MLHGKYYSDGNFETFMQNMSVENALHLNSLLQNEVAQNGKADQDGLRFAVYTLQHCTNPVLQCMQLLSTCKGH